MKLRIILLVTIAVLSSACNTMRSGKAEICRTAYVAQVPAENEAAVRAQCLNLEVSGAIERRGCYLREIDSRLYLFQYLEKNSPSDLVNFQGLEKLVKPLPVATGNGRAFESMERIFYEPGTADKTPEGDVKRIAMFTELKRDKEAHYRLLHANPWPDVIAAIKKANFRHFSIFLEEINGKVYLFGWLEYVGNDISADDAINKQNPASIRWWKETDACQIAPDDAGGGMWGGMKELFFAE